MEEFEQYSPQLWLLKLSYLDLSLSYLNLSLSSVSVKVGSLRSYVVGVSQG